MNTINNTSPIQIRRMSVTDQQGKKTEFSRSTKSVNNDSSQHPQVTTNKKTVHLKDVKQLHNEINNLISSIKNILIAGEKISTQHLFTNDSPIFKKINTKINELGNKVTELKDKLDSSSYKHHKSKKTDLDSLDRAFKSKNSQVNQLKNEMTELQNSRPSSKELLAEKQQVKKTETTKNYYDISEAINDKEIRRQKYEEGYK